MAGALAACRADVGGIPPVGEVASARPEGTGPAAAPAPDAGTVDSGAPVISPAPGNPPNTSPAPDAGSASAACAAGAVACAGLVPQTCGADGRWVDGPACAFACRGGCVTQFAAVSAGRGAATDDEGRAAFTRNGATLYSEKGGLLGKRGFNVAVVDPRTGAMLEPVRNFDQWATPLSARALEEMADYLDALEPGRLVMVAACDDAGINPPGSCDKHDTPAVARLLAALARLGSREINDYCFRGAWSFISLTGAAGNTPLAERLSAGEKVTAEVMLRSER